MPGLAGTELAEAPEFGECGVGAVVHGRASWDMR